MPAKPEQPNGEHRESREQKSSKNDVDSKNVDSIEEISEEDRQLKENLEMLIGRIHDSDDGIRAAALEQLKSIIRTSTSSMTAIPKPLKFLQPHYEPMQKFYETWPESETKLKFADILSALGMTNAESDKRLALIYRLHGVTEDPGLWGHEYVRHLASEIGEEYNARREISESNGEERFDHEDLDKLALELVPFFLTHNAEADAVDLLMEIELVRELPGFVDQNSVARVSLYMLSCVKLLTFPESEELLETVFQIYLKHDRLLEANNCALMLSNRKLIEQVYSSTDDKSIKKQIALVCGRMNESISEGDDELADCFRNTHLTSLFHNLVVDLEIFEPKVPEDIYKSHLESFRAGVPVGIDTVKQNLAATFVNAFVNAGFGNDKLMLTEDDSKSWIYKTKSTGMLSSAASIGMLTLWNVELGLSSLDKYLYSSDEFVKAGALLGIGISNVHVRNESEPALAILDEYLTDASGIIRRSAVVGLGLAYAGTEEEKIVDILLPIATDINQSMEIASLAALSVGLVLVGSGDGDAISSILQTLMERDEIQLGSEWSIFMALGLAILLFGQRDVADTTIETLKAIESPVARIAEVLVEICSYVGSGNVLTIQKLMHLCGEAPKHREEEDDIEKTDTTISATSKSDQHADDNEDETMIDDKAEDKDDLGSDDDADKGLIRSIAVLGVALVAMGEDIGAEMVLRQFGHMMHYGDRSIRKAVPLAMGLLSASNPDMRTYETLSRYSHDTERTVAINSIFSMGLVGTGTNNARLAQLLRQLANFYSREPNTLFMVRIAQGLVHAGKGTITIQPYDLERQLLNKVGLAGLVTVFVSLVVSKDDTQTFIMRDSHWLLYYLSLSMRPRMLSTLNEDLEPLPVPVRVGQAVDVVGQAGRPKTITGWVTQTTPVLLHHGERAELATEEYIPLAATLEGVVILRKNPDYMEA